MVVSLPSSSFQAVCGARQEADGTSWPGSEAPEQIIQRVDMLTNAFRAMGVMRPASAPLSTRQLLSDWSQALRRLAQEKVTKSDKATIVNALRTWNEFEEHLAVRA